MGRLWGASACLRPVPVSIWSSLVARHSRNPHASAIHNINPLGSERFREEICAYLRTSRAVKCDPAQIMVVSGSQQALDITARVLLDPGDSVLVEEPGYSLERTLLAASGCRLNLVPVDNEGMDVTQGIQLHSGAKVAFVTPSHHYPLGSTMSATRRLFCLIRPQTSGAWIVEDDYDSEYRFDTRPIASLQGLDVNSPRDLHRHLQQDPLSIDSHRLHSHYHDVGPLLVSAVCHGHFSSLPVPGGARRFYVARPFRTTHPEDATGLQRAQVHAH